MDGREIESTEFQYEVPETTVELLTEVTRDASLANYCIGMMHVAIH